MKYKWQPDVYDGLFDVMSGTKPLTNFERLYRWRIKFELYKASKPLTVFGRFCDGSL